MLRILPAMALLVMFSGEAVAAYTCTNSIFTKRCSCTTKADCDQMRKDNVCGSPNMLCNAEGSRCTCSVSRLPLRQLQPARPILSQ